MRVFGFEVFVMMCFFELSNVVVALGYFCSDLGVVKVTSRNY